MLKPRGAAEESHHVWTVRTMVDAAMLVTDAMCEVDRRADANLKAAGAGFSVFFIVGRQILGGAPAALSSLGAGNLIDARLKTP